MSGPATPVAGARGRLLGVDAARGVALLGMMSVHVLPALTADGDFSASRLIASGRSAALFAVLAGVSLALATARHTAPAPSRRHWLASGLSTAVRALVILAVGLFLGTLDSGVAVILTYYGLLFLLAIPFLGLPARALLPLAAVWAVVTPVISHALRDDAPRASFDNPTLESLGDPVGLLRELLLTGYYPAFPWMAYLLAGLGLGRLALGTPKVAGWLLGGGVALAAGTWATSWLIVERAGLDHLISGGLGDQPASPLDFTTGVLHTSFFGNTPTTTWWWLTVASPHSSTPFDLLHTIGTATAVLGLMLLIAPRARALVWPLAAIGGMTFTLYSLHVVLLATAVPGDTLNVYLTHVAIAFAVAMPWRAFVGRGPLEGLAATMSRSARELALSPRDHQRSDPR
jgi:uncharacterized membrane protein